MKSRLKTCLTCLPVAMAALISTQTAAQVSETINVSLTIQTKPKEIALSGLNDISLGFDGTQLSGDPSDAFCLYASNTVALTFSSSNGTGDQFFLAGSGKNIMYDVNLVSNVDFDSLADQSGFDHGVANTIQHANLANDRACTEGDNALLQIDFPRGGTTGIDTVTQTELADGAAHHYRDLLTVTVEPVL